MQSIQHTRTCCASCSDCNSLAMLNLLCLYHAINLYVYRSTGLDISSHFGQAIRGPETLDIWPHFSYFFSKSKQKTSLIEEMVALSLNLEDCDPISFVYISFFHNNFLYYQSIFLHNLINCFTQRDLKEKYMKIIFTIFEKRQSKRSNKSAGYKL